LIRETDTSNLAELYTSRSVLSVAAEVTFNSLLFTLIEIYSFGFERTCFNTSFTSSAKLWIYVNNPLFLIKTHRGVLFRAGIITGVIYTMLAGVNYMIE